MSFIEWWNEFIRATTNLHGQAFGPAHIVVGLFVTFTWVFLGIFLGIKFKNKERKSKMRVLKISCIILIIIEILRFVQLLCVKRPMINIVYEDLPLYLCDIAVFLIPIMIFTKGKIQNACMEYLICIGVLSAFMGTWFNIGMINDNPIWSFPMIWAFINHTIPAFCGLFIAVSRLGTLNFKHIGYTMGIICPFLIIDLSLDFGTGQANYMFLRHSNGTPFALFEKLANGNVGAYCVMVIIGMALYIFVFYLVWYLIAKLIKNKQQKKQLNGTTK